MFHFVRSLKKVLKLIINQKLISFLQCFYFGVGEVGVGTRISPSAKFSGKKKRISIGSRVIIESGAYVECEGELSKLHIGDSSILRRGSMVITGNNGSVITGKSCSLNPYSILYGHGGLVLGDFVRVAAHVVVIPANHVFSDTSKPITEQGLSKLGIKIGNDVWLGTGVKVLDGVKIGDGVVVAAGAVVTKNIPDLTVVAGVPAKHIKKR